MNPVLLEGINAACGGGVGYGLPPVELVPSGLHGLDAAIGGIPRGRIVELHGGEGSGKTALVLRLARQLPGAMLYIDADHGLSPYILGDQEVYLLDVPSLEDALDACRTAAASGAFGAIVIDSVAALPTREDLRVPLGLVRERQAKVLSKALPMLAGTLRRTGCTLFLVNQLRIKPGIVYGNPEYPTGGGAIGYYAALRLRTKWLRPIQAGGTNAGFALRATVTKCKYGPPGRSAELSLVYEWPPRCEGEGWAPADRPRGFV